ncbi:hypothetical protein PR202_gb22683 [Eleusine coracana subsp. coracana]|uniref:Ubiquitin-like domain-containing protein n=1 Tax=Eleusine coracana subsp. coracana TaxID=191504 RepID=A0AAV5FGY2_ELECO|nr:hypothetical protein PR202_gb22683 [Eleusine coracana subsp. coracana]
MKVSVKTLKGSSFEIQVEPVNKGKVLKDDTTLEENKVLENNFLVIMLRQNKGSSSVAAATSKAPSNQAPPTQTVSATTPASQAPAAPAPTVPISAPAPTATASPVPAVAVSTEADSYGQAASNLVAGSNLEATIQDDLVSFPTIYLVFLDNVLAFLSRWRFLRHLQVLSQQTPPRLHSQLKLQFLHLDQMLVPWTFPQALPNASANAGAGNLDVLRNNTQFQSLLALVQANPAILQPLLQEFGKTKSPDHAANSGKPRKSSCTCNAEP